MSSKVSFRPRMLDQHRPLNVYHADELPDLYEYAAINRQVAAMPTGMEKEEEMELHLVEAITAQQAYNTGNPSTSGITIPTPRVTSDVSYYEDVYLPKHKSTNNLIKVEASLHVEPELCEYDADSDDERWLTNLRNKNTEISYDDFEMVMDRLEKASERQVISLKEAHALLPCADDDVLQTVYDYWVEKRLRVKHALCPRVRNERRDTTQANVASPYIAFRRRGEKMQTRKNRKNDEDGYERILKLSHDLRKAAVLLEMLKRREKSKRELINLHAEIVDKRYSMADWMGLAYKECEREAKPSFQFANVEPTRKGSALKLANNNNNQQYRDGRKRKTQRSERDEGLASRGWLQQNADDWHRTYGFPSSPPHRNASPAASQLAKQSAIASVLESVDALASTSTNVQLDGEFVFKRRRGCVYHAPKSAHSTNENTSDNTSDYTSLKDSARQQLSNAIDHVYPWENVKYNPHLAFYPTYLPSRHGCHSAQLRYIGMARRRVARGGRVVYDRQPLPHSDDAPPSTINLNAPQQSTHNYYRPSNSTPVSTPNSDPCLASTAVDKDDLDDCMSLVCRTLPNMTDSGYSSPASIRSRSLNRNGNGMSMKPLPMDTPYAMVRGASGDVCCVPITVGVSPALFSAHQQRVAQLWPTTTTTVSNSAEPTQQPANTPELLVDRIRAFQAGAAVQSASFVDSLVTSRSGTHKQQQQFTPQQHNGAADTPPPYRPPTDVNTTNHHHHPMPTPSPSPNDDHLNDKIGAVVPNAIDGTSPLDSTTSSPPQTDDHQHLHIIMNMSDQYHRPVGGDKQQTQLHRNNNAVVR